MRYRFITLLIVMSTILQGTPPRLTASEKDSQHNTCLEHQTTAADNPYRYLGRPSPWPTCQELLECAQCCCHAVFVLAKLCIKDAYRRQENRR